MQGKRIIALILSFFIPGAGQIYLDRVLRGILILVAFFAILFTMPWVFAWIGYVITAGFWIWQLYDVDKIAKRLEQPAKSQTQP